MGGAMHAQVLPGASMTPHDRRTSGVMVAPGKATCACHVCPGQIDLMLFGQVPENHGLHVLPDSDSAAWLEATGRRALSYVVIKMGAGASMRCAESEARASTNSTPMELRKPQKITFCGALLVN